MLLDVTTTAALCPSATHGKQWLCPSMTKKLLTVSINKNTNKQALFIVLVDICYI